MTVKENGNAPVVVDAVFDPEDADQNPLENRWGGSASC